MGFQYVVGGFWATILLQALIKSRHSIYNSCKLGLTSIGSTISSIIRKRLQKKKINEKKSEEKPQEIAEEISVILYKDDKDTNNNSQILEFIDRMEDQIVSDKQLESSRRNESFKNKHKLISKKDNCQRKKIKNVAEYVQGYKHWLRLNRKVKGEINSFHTKDNENHQMSNELQKQVRIAMRRPSTIQNYEELVQRYFQDIDNEEYKNMLPYDPFVSDDEE